MYMKKFLQALLEVSLQMDGRTDAQDLCHGPPPLEGNNYKLKNTLDCKATMLVSCTSYNIKLQAFDIKTIR